MKRMRKGYTEEENKKIENAIENGGDIEALAKELNRGVKSMKDHYRSYMNGRKKFTYEEDQLLLSLCNKYGAKYRLFIRFFPNATCLNLRDEANKLMKKNFNYFDKFIN